MTTKDNWFKNLWTSIGESLQWFPEPTIITETKIKEVPVEKIVEKVVEVNKDTELDKFCQRNFKEVDKFAYKDKGIFKDIRYSMYPNELIQPELFIIKQLREEIPYKTNQLQWAGEVAKYVDRRLTWVADENTDNTLDAYQDIYATILSPKQDCENHASLVSSIEPEFGIMFGFCGTTGHAWNVMVKDGELYCIETNSVQNRSRNYKVFKYADQDRYKAHWIFTQDHTYQLVGKPTHFGYKDR